MLKNVLFNKSFGITKYSEYIFNNNKTLINTTKQNLLIYPQFHNFTTQTRISDTIKYEAKQSYKFSIPKSEPRIIHKAIYKESIECSGTSKLDIDKYLKEHSISVRYSKMENIPKPLLSLDHPIFPTSIETHIKSKFKSPTCIQSIAWPIALSGLNMVGIAETGSGKTLSFVLPGIVHIRHQKLPKHNKNPVMLVIAPTRELANQISSVFNEYTHISKLKSVCIYGGVSKYNQIKQVGNGVDIVVATPGRLLDLIGMGKLTLEDISFVVLDEADRMLDMGFEQDLRKILGMINPSSQLLMWSATWPREIRNLAEEFLKDYVHIKVGGEGDGLSLNKRIAQNFIFCRGYDKDGILRDLLTEVKAQAEPGDEQFPRTIIFSNYKNQCDTLVHNLKEMYPIDCIHGDKDQRERDSVIGRFKRGDVSILCATDVAARGLDISDVKVIINYDFPNNLDDYVHRIGRTGRSGKTGIAYSLFTDKDNGQAKNLVHLLKKANQEVPHELENRANASFSSYRKRGGSSYRKY